MRSFQEQRYWRALFDSRAFMLILFVVLFYLAFKVSILFTLLFKEDKKLHTLRQEVQELQRRKETAITKLDGLEHGNTLEKEARSNFNIKRPGERTVVIVDPRTGDQPEEDSTGVFSRIRSWFERE